MKGVVYLLAAVTAALAAFVPSAAAASLNVDVQVIAGAGSDESCPSGSPAVLCGVITERGSVRGLGAVTYTMHEQWLQHPDDAAKQPDSCSHQNVLATLATPKGAIDLSGTGKLCVGAGLPTLTRELTATAGSDRLAGATGSFQVTGNRSGDRIQGTLVAPQVAVFDLAPPRFRGVANRVVKVARRAPTRVRFAVSARDATDGAVPVTCVPRSGSRFPVGRTIVTCRASDSSGNAATAHFAVTVRVRTR